MLPEASITNSEQIRPVLPITDNRPKILLADDHRLILDALKAMMSNEFNVLAVDNSEAFLNEVETFQPDVAILDINMPGEDGFTTAKRVLARRPGLPIVFLSMYADSQYVDEATRLGARAYLSKGAPAQDLITAIQAVLDGERPVSFNGTLDGSPSLESSKVELTARQREVLRLIAMGSSAKDIANQLNISVRTAEFHRAAIMQRLGLHSTAQMTRYAIVNNIA